MEDLYGVAFVDDNIAAYITLKLESSYKAFAKNKISEIGDLNILPIYRNQGIGSKLISTAPKEAIKKQAMLLESELVYILAMMVDMVLHKGYISN